VHLWADRFDGSLENVFDIQDKVASSVAGVIEPALQAAETARSVRHPTRDLNAYDAYLRAYEMHMQSAKRIPEALDLLQQAIHDDPEYGPALAWASVCCVRLVSDGLSKDPAMHRSQGLEFARRALQVARDDPSVCAHAAIALSFFGDDTSAVLALVDRALSLNPSYARGWYVSGMMRLWAGDPDTAAAHAEISLRLDPRGGVASMVIGGALFIRERYDEALPYLLSAVQDHPDFPLPYRILAACYARSGQLQKAREVIERIRAISTAVLPPMGPWRDAKHQELFLSGLRLAMGEVA